MLNHNSETAQVFLYQEPRQPFDLRLSSSTMPVIIEEEFEGRWIRLTPSDSAVVGPESVQEQPQREEPLQGDRQQGALPQQPPIRY